MSEEQLKQGGEPQENPIEESIEDHKRGSKVILLAIVLIVAVAGVVLVRQSSSDDSIKSQDTNTPLGAQDQSESGPLGGISGATADVAPESTGTVVDDGAGFKVDAPDNQAKEFTITGRNFKFSIGEIKVKKGDTVRINFSSVDGFHDWGVDEFSARTERVNTGGESSVTFVADKSGTFEYYCSVGNHRQLGMVGNLIVE